MDLRGQHGAGSLTCCATTTAWHGTTLLHNVVHCSTAYDAPKLAQGCRMCVAVVAVHLLCCVPHLSAMRIFCITALS
jgi:hypothetical protein